MLKKIRKGIKRFMNEKVETYKEVLATSENRLILGLIFVGTGVGYSCCELTYLIINKEDNNHEKRFN